MKKRTVQHSLATVKERRGWRQWAVLPALTILSLILIKKKKDDQTLAKINFKKEAMGEGVDFNNIIESSFHANILYDELKVKCHPDRFPNDLEKNKIAETLFQEIAKNKTNIKKLAELKEQAKHLLEINF